MWVFIYKNCRYKIGVLFIVLFYITLSLNNTCAQTTQPQTQPSIIDNVGWHTFFLRHPSSAQIISFAKSGFNKMVVPGYYAANDNIWVSDMSVIDSLNNYNIHSIVDPNDTILVPAFTKKHLGSLLANGTIAYMATSLDTSVKKWINKFGRDGVAGVLYDIEEVPGTMLYQVSAPKEEIDVIDSIKIFLSQDSTDDSSPLGYNSSYDKIAQVFHPTYHYLGHVTLKAKIIGTPGQFAVSCWNVDSNGKPSSKVNNFANVIVNPGNFSDSTDQKEYKYVTVYFHNDPDATLISEFNKGASNITPPTGTATVPVKLNDKLYAIVIDYQGTYSTSNYYSFAGTTQNYYDHTIDGLNTCFYKGDNAATTNWTSYPSNDLYFDFNGKMTTVDENNHSMSSKSSDYDWTWTNGYSYMPSDKWVTKKNNQIDSVASKFKQAVIDGYNLSTKKFVTDINTIGKGYDSTDHWPLGYNSYEAQLLQKFKPKYSQLSKVDIRMTRVSVPGNIKVYIQEWNSAGNIPGLKRDSATITSSMVQTAGAYQNVEVSFTSASLNTNKYYTIVFVYQGPYDSTRYYQFARPSVKYNLGYAGMCDSAGVNWRYYGDTTSLAFKTVYSQAPDFIVYSAPGNKDYYYYSGLSNNEAYGVDWATMKNFVTVVNAGLNNIDLVPPSKTRAVIGQLPLWTHIWNDSSGNTQIYNGTNITAIIDTELQYSFFPSGYSQQNIGGMSYGTSGINTNYDLGSTIKNTNEANILSSMASEWTKIIANEKHYIDNAVSSNVVPQINNIAKAVTERSYKYTLEANYPNPFNPSTIIEYQLPSNGLVTLKVYDILGKEIKALVNENKAPGKYTAIFDGSKLASGIYFYQLRAGNFISTKKMLLLK